MGWFQFRLRTLLVVTLLIAVLALCWARQRQRFRQLEERRHPASISDDALETLMREWEADPATDDAP